MREADDERRPCLGGLAKCALFASFLLALAIWWCVPDAADMPHQPPPPSPSPLAHARLHAHGAAAGGANSFLVSDHGPAGRARRRPGHAHAAHHEGRAAHQTVGQTAQQQAQQHAASADARSEEVKKASADPNSMFDMSTP